jgi:peptidoglycan/xylan/chitin deacetylase (PgdA/CDA1 family)
MPPRDSKYSLLGYYVFRSQRFCREIRNIIDDTSTKFADSKMHLNLRKRMRVRTRLRSAARRIWPPKPKPLILMYHRIADEPVDPWGLAVTPAHFEEHLHVLRRTRQPISLTEFARSLSTGTLRPDAVAVTFDDGYADNLVAAKPRLAAVDVPATVFLTTGYVHSQRKFWWDELAKIILFGNGPRNFEITVRGQVIRCDVGTDPPARQDVSSTMTSQNSRRQALTSIWRALRPLEENERDIVMNDIASTFTVAGRHDQPGPAMTVEEVKALTAGGLITIGAHTVTHPVLPALDMMACRQEVENSKRSCESLIGTSVTSFAYPYGDFDSRSREEVERAGFTIACSTKHGPVVPSSDILALPRIYISDQSGDNFEETLRLGSAVA